MKLNSIRVNVTNEIMLANTIIGGGAPKRGQDLKEFADKTSHKRIKAHENSSNLDPHGVFDCPVFAMMPISLGI